MFSIFEVSGRQYKVSEGSTIIINRINLEPGSETIYDKIHLIMNENNLYTSPKATITCQVVEHLRGKKIHIIKFRRRKSSMKRMGHRQDLTKLKVISINL
jgi:large subunit ribosomal protein L21